MHSCTEGHHTSAAGLNSSSLFQPILTTRCAPDHPASCLLQWRFAEIMYRRAPSSSRSSSTPSTPDADVERVVLFVVDPWAVAAPNPASVSALSAAQQAAAGARGTRA